MAKKPLTDWEVRALAAGTPTATGVETVLRQSRRVNRKYEKAHVHTGDVDPGDDGASAAEAPAGPTTDGATPAPSHLPRNAKAERIERRAEALAGNAPPAARDKAGPNFAETERAAAAGVAAIDRREHDYNLLAWDAFEREYEFEAAELSKVWTRATDKSRELERRGRPDDAFAVMLASWAERAGRTAPAREKHRARLAEMWRTWRAYLKQWRRDHPGAQLPDAPTGPRHLPDVAAVLAYRAQPEAQPIAAAVHAGLYGQPPAAPAVPVGPVTDPLVTEWERQGMPLCDGGMFCLKTLDQVLKEFDDGWLLRSVTDSELREAANRNNAKMNYLDLYRRHRPRSLLDV